MKVKPFGAATVITIAFWSLFTAPRQAQAAQNYVCTSDRCTCSGKADCKELLGSDWCSGVLKCGSVAGLPPGDCRCDVEMKKVPKLQPGSKHRPDVKVQ